MLVVQLASPARHNKDNSHMFIKGYKNGCRKIILVHLYFAAQGKNLLLLGQQNKRKIKNMKGKEKIIKAQEI